MRCYCPILKGKAGEFKAVSNLSKTVGESIFPIFEIPPSEPVFGKEIGVVIGTKKNAIQLIDAFATQLRKSVTPLPEFTVDLSHIDLKTRVDGKRPSTYFFARCDEFGLSPTIVLNLDSHSEVDGELVNMISKRNSNIAVRVSGSLCSFPTSIESNLKSLIQTTGTETSDVSLLIDFGQITRGDVDEIVDKCVAIQEECSLVHSMRRIVLTATSMPDSATLGIKAFEVDAIPRIEWALWKKVRKSTSFDFGDYGVLSPTYFELDFRAITLAGKVRYTASNSWVVIKGQKMEGHGSQFHKLASILTDHQSFKDKTFCWGDKQIVDCAKRKIGPGNLTTWLAFTTNHHITLVSRQVANAA